MRTRTLTNVSILLMVAAGMMRADFRYSQTTKVTGGAMVGLTRTLGVFSRDMRSLTEPQTQTVMVKGNRMTSFDVRTMHIVDLDAETITDVNLDKKTYSVITFAQMAEALEKAAQRMKEMQSQRGQEAPAADVKYKFSVKETGQKRTISGLEAKEMLLVMEAESQDQKSGTKGAMDITTNIWLAPDVPGYQEVREFYQRMAGKMAGMFGPQAGAMAMNPQFSKGMAEMAKEAAKLEGVQVLQVARIGAKVEGVPESGQSGQAAPQQPSQPAPSAREAGERSTSREVMRRLPGGLGGLGGLGRRKRTEEAPPPPPPPPAESQPAQTQTAQGSLMEITTELSDFGQGGVDASKFQVPGGFKQEEHPMLKMGRR
jgi:hypothetical protein